jgi:hypothetical protein
MSEEIRHRSWRISIHPAPISAFLSPARETDLAEVDSVKQWISVEALLAISGMRPHGLLVANFDPGGNELETRIFDTGAFDLSGLPVTSMLGRPLNVGLPLDLGQAAVVGAKSANLSVLGFGCLNLVGGGIDYDSAEFIFERLGELAVVALAARALRLSESAEIQNAISTW